MTKLTFRKNFNSLVPDEATDPAAAEWLRKVKHGTYVTIERPKSPRNVQHHRLFFALVNLVFENQEHYETVEHLLTAMKIGLGHCDTLTMKDGGVAYLPKSISFAKMSQEQFNEFYDRAIALVVRHFLPGVTDEEVRRQVEELVAA